MELVLQSFHGAKKAYFINKKAEGRLLFDVDEIAAKNQLAVAFLVTINSRADSSNVRPGWIFPSVTQKELVPDWVIVEPDVAVV